MPTEKEPVLDALRAMLTAPLPTAPADPAADLARLEREMEEAWKLWYGAHNSAIQIYPDTIRLDEAVQRWMDARRALVAQGWVQRWEKPRCQHKGRAVPGPGIDDDPSDPEDASMDAAPLCPTCGFTLDGWYCPESPSGVCVYEQSDNCRHCGQPEERK